ncbi:RNA polymerase sigma factor SigJ [Cellulomonas sp. 73-145]|uniref:RNA polymerase sigma factor SigJ n=1 Tax=Cellulomonas sp. 73-145 TaxID=1895739 RepID=UPI003450EE0C
MTVDDGDGVAASFEAQRGHLHAVAYRMLGSLSDADDAVQETWLRLARSDPDEIRNLGGWLTTVVSRVCLDLLRTRQTRREDPLDVHLPDPVVTRAPRTGPEEQAVAADSVGLALLVVLDTLSPAERLAFVLHDVFAVPFHEVASILDRTPAAAKQLASRARRRVRGAEPSGRVDSRRHRQVVDAFLAASREGDLDALLAVLDPDVVLRADAGSGPLGPSQLVQGAPAVARQALRFASLAVHARPVVVNGRPGLLGVRDDIPFTLLSVAVRGDVIVEIDILADPQRLARLDLAGLIDR